MTTESRIANGDESLSTWLFNELDCWAPPGLIDAAWKALGLDPEMSVERLRQDLDIAARARQTGLYSTGKLGVTAPHVPGYITDAVDLRSFIP